MYKFISMIGFVMLAAVSAGATEDPTRPPAKVTLASVAAAEAQVPVLSSIVYSDQRRLAVINGELFLEGQSKGDLVLLEVLADNVLVQIGAQEQLTLHLGSGRINKELK